MLSLQQMGRLLLAAISKPLATYTKNLDSMANLPRRNISSGQKIAFSWPTGLQCGYKASRKQIAIFVQAIGH
jgi:hypothetical protein